MARTVPAIRHARIAGRESRRGYPATRRHRYERTMACARRAAHGLGPAARSGRAAFFRGATGWLNSPPLTQAGLRGKVVLVGFWNYTCINWLRQLPYPRAWAGKYSGHGLVVIGVHTPEFRFEHDVDNVRRAVKSIRVDYPVAIDNDYAIWRAFDNHYWPALYFADAQGRIRHHHSAKASTSSRKWSSSSSWPKPDPAAPARGWFRPACPAWKPPPTGPP